MVTTGHIKVKHSCNSCKQSCTRKHYGKVVNILDLGKDVAKPYKCTICCSGTMSVIRVSCEITKDIYGDDRTGYWMCKDYNHDTMKFYPLPIRKAHLKDDPHYKEDWGTMADSYEKIVEGGTPWRCPLCHRLLKYKTEETPI